MTRPVRCSVVPVAGEPGAPGDLASVRLCSPAALTPIDIAGSGFVAAALTKMGCPRDRRRGCPRARFQRCDGFGRWRS